MPALQPNSAAATQSSALTNMWCVLLAQAPDDNVATEQSAFFAPQPNTFLIKYVTKATNCKATILLTTTRPQERWINTLYHSASVNITAACSENTVLCTSTVACLVNYHFSAIHIPPVQLNIGCGCRQATYTQHDADQHSNYWLPLPNYQYTTTDSTPHPHCLWGSALRVPTWWW